MTKLLTDSDFAEIRSAIGDVSETFLQKEITYRLFQDAMSRMNSDGNRNATYYDCPVNGLIVWSEKQPIETRQGIVDLSDGYILLNYDAIEAITYPVPEVEEGEEAPIPEKVFFGSGLLMQEAQDRLIIDGEEMLILMVQQIGQLKDRNVMIKLFFQKQAPSL